MWEKVKAAAKKMRRGQSLLDLLVHSKVFELFHKNNERSLLCFL